MEVWWVAAYKGVLLHGPTDDRPLPRFLSFLLHEPRAIRHPRNKAPANRVPPRHTRNIRTTVAILDVISQLLTRL